MRELIKQLIEDPCVEPDGRMTRFEALPDGWVQVYRSKEQFGEADVSDMTWEAINRWRLARIDPDGVVTIGREVPST